MCKGFDLFIDSMTIVDSVADFVVVANFVVVVDVVLESIETGMWIEREARTTWPLPW